MLSVIVFLGSIITLVIVLRFIFSSTNKAPEIDIEAEIEFNRQFLNKMIEKEENDVNSPLYKMREKSLEQLNDLIKKQEEKTAEILGNYEDDLIEDDYLNNKKTTIEGLKEDNISMKSQLKHLLTNSSTLSLASTLTIEYYDTYYNEYDLYQSAYDLLNEFYSMHYGGKNISDELSMLICENTRGDEVLLITIICLIDISDNSYVIENSFDHLDLFYELIQEVHIQNCDEEPDIIVEFSNYITELICKVLNSINTAIDPSVYFYPTRDNIISKLDSKLRFSFYGNLNKDVPLFEFFLGNKIAQYEKELEREIQKSNKSQMTDSEIFNLVADCSDWLYKKYTN